MVDSHTHTGTPPTRACTNAVVDTVIAHAFYTPCVAYVGHARTHIGGCTMTDTNTIDTTTDAWSDYDAVVNGGVTNAARARDRGITASTVSANVRRIRDAIAAGASTPDGTTSTGTTTDNPSTWTVGALVTRIVGDDVPPMLVRAITDAFASVDTAERAIARATVDRDTAVTMRDAVCARMGVDAAYVVAHTGTTVATDDDGNVVVPPVAPARAPRKSRKG